MSKKARNVRNFQFTLHNSPQNQSKENIDLSYWMISLRETEVNSCGVKRYNKIVRGDVAAFFFPRRFSCPTTWTHGTNINILITEQ